MSQLFTPLSLGKLELDNRIIIAQSGAGLLIIEATAIEPEGRITYGDVGLWDDKTEAAMAKTLAAVRSHSDIPIAV